MGGLSYSFAVKALNNSKRIISPKRTKKDYLIGVICIDINANYFVRINKTYNEFKDYPLHEKELSCVNKEVVWKFSEKDYKHIQWIRNKDMLHELSYQWKPFKPGTVVIGYIDNNSLFNIHKIKYDYLELYDENDDIEKHSILCDSTIKFATQFYKDNEKEIKINYKKLYGTA